MMMTMVMMMMMMMMMERWTNRTYLVLLLVSFSSLFFIQGHRQAKCLLTASSSLGLLSLPPHSASSLCLLTLPLHSASSLCLLTLPPHSASSLCLLTLHPQLPHAASSRCSTLPPHSASSMSPHCLTVSALTRSQWPPRLSLLPQISITRPSPTHTHSFTVVSPLVAHH
jgi:hypothetical protein